MPFRFITINSSYITACCQTGEQLVTDGELIGTMVAGESKVVTISEGCPPYTWETSSSDFSWDEAMTNDTTNTLTCDAITTETTITIKDTCCDYLPSNEISARSIAATADDSTSGTVYSIIFLAQAIECFNPGNTDEISLSGTYEITNVDVLTPDCSSTGTDMIQLTTPASQGTAISVGVDMEASGYTKVGGGSVTGRSIATIGRCQCGAAAEASIGYTTQNVVPGGQYNYTVEGVTPSAQHNWEFEGGGTIHSIDPTTRTCIYSAPENPTSSPYCTARPILKLTCDGQIIDTVPLYPWRQPNGFYVAYRVCSDRDCYYAFGEYRNRWFEYTCGSSFKQQRYVNFGTYQDCIDACPGPEGFVYDVRDDSARAIGCCPPALL